MDIKSRTIFGRKDLMFERPSTQKWVHCKIVRHSIIHINDTEQP